MRPLVAEDFPVDAQKAGAGQQRVQDLKCTTCHGPTFAGSGLVPRLAGQSQGYLVKQLDAFAASRRPHASTDMPVGQAEIEAVAHYLASLR